MSDVVLDAETPGGPVPPPVSLDALPGFAGAAEGRALVVAGERAAVVGDDRAGVREVLLHPIRAVAGLRTGLPAAERVRVATGGAERRLQTDAGPVTESVLVYRRLPGVVFRWSREEGEPGSGPLHLRLTWHCPGARPPDGEDGTDPDDQLRLALTGRPGALLFSLRGAPARWRIAQGDAGDEPGLSVQVRSSLAPGRAVALVVTLVRDGGTEADAVLSRLSRPSAEVAGWAEDARRAREEGLALEADDQAPGAAMAWALHRLPASLVRPGGRRPGRVISGYGGGCPGAPRARVTASRLPAGDVPPPASATELAWIGHGLLAAGRHRDARDAVTRGLERLDAGGGSGRPDPPDREDAALLLHLAARYALWTGDARPLRRRRAVVDRSVERMGSGLDDEGGTSRTVAVAAAYRDLADALEAGGDPAGGDPLRSRWETLRRRLASAPFPAPSAAARFPDPRVLAAVLETPGPGLEGASEDAGPAGGLASGLRAWAEWVRGDPEAALRRWRALLAAGAEDRRGLWGLDGEGAKSEASGRAGGPCHWHSATTALAVAPLVFGLLGARADAAYGRLRLAPRIPAGWRRFRVRGLRVGDVRVRLDYRREGRRHTFVLAPTAGRVPLNMVFEPLLPEKSIGEVEVGGETADVDVYEHADRVGLRLQLPLDSRREISVGGADGQG